MNNNLSEQEYYKKLFVENPRWNKATPNNEEKLRWDIIDKFIRYIVDGDKDIEKSKRHILDVGCGRGWLCNLLTEYGDVTGIEPVEEVVKFANNLFPLLDIRTGTTKMLLANKQFEKYDIIVCSEVIEHIPDRLKSDFVNDLKLLLQTNGFLIVTTPRKEVQVEWMNFTSPDQPIEDWLDEKSLEQLFTKANFNAHFTERYSVQPTESSPQIEVYQLWLFQKI